jgi:hypothetical protein
VLGDEAAWLAFARLSRQVEAPGDEGRAALREIRATLDAVEGAAWAEADDLWQAEAAPPRWRDAAQRWDAATRSALAHLTDPT